MNLLALTDYLGNVGGAEISTKTILKELAGRPDVEKVTVIGIDPPGEDQFVFDEIDVVPITAPDFVINLPEYVGDHILEYLFLKVARNYIDAADIVHAHHRRSTLALSSLDPSIPTVSTIRDFWPACPISTLHIGDFSCNGCENNLDRCVGHHDWDGVLEPVVKSYLQKKREHQRTALENIDQGIFISNHLRERLEKYGPLPPQNEVVYNPVAVPKDVVPKDFRNPTFVTASSLSESKGIETAIRAISKVNKEGFDSQLIILGDGPREDELKSLANEIARTSVTFEGRVPQIEVYRNMAGAKATIFPSEWAEPFGRVTVESMSLGTPVLGGNVGGIAEVIEDGTTGLLYPSGDQEALAEQMMVVTKDQRLRQKLIKEGKNRSKHFQPENIVDQHLDLYKSLL